MKKEVYSQIVKKKDFSKLPKKDVEMIYGLFAKREVSEEEKIRLTREMLHKVFGAFTSQKLLSPKKKDAEWILRKHLSTRERLPYYSKLYMKLLKGYDSLTVIDLGCGVNGFSFENFPTKVKYVGVEAVGQLVDLQNDFFKRRKFNGKVYHMSLFDLDRVKKLIKKEKKPKIVFLFKTLDSLEMVERDYSKLFLKAIVPLVDKVVVSFATRSMVSRKKFGAKRSWLTSFIEKFNVIESFELGGERYIIFSK